MSIINKGNPGDFSPVYNPVVFYFDSTNKNKLGFRYVVDIYYSGTTNKIGELRVAPRPVDKYGYCDISKLLSSEVTFNFDPNNNSTLDQSNSFIKYDVKIGEEYIVDYGIASLTNNGGYVQITSSASNPFIVGDGLNVNSNLLNGLFVVTTDTSSTQVTIDAPWSVSYSGTVSGTVSYADNRKTITRDLLTYSNYVCYNASFNFVDFIDYDSADYKLNNTSFPPEKLLTDIPSVYYVYNTQDLWVNYAPYYDSTAKYMYFENSNGDIYYRNIQDSTTAIKQCAVGPNNVGALTLVSGTGSLIKPDTEWYEFWVGSTSSIAMTSRYRMNILKDCKIEDYEIVFLDRKGSFGSFAFPLRSKITNKVDSNRYNNQIGNLSGGKYSYNSYDIWSTTTGVDYETELELITNWFKSDEQLEYYNQLVSSPYTWIKLQKGIYCQCQVVTTTNEVNKLNNKKLQNKTLKVKLINEIINI